LFQRGLSTQNNREVTKNKAALSTKKPPSVPGFIARAQQRNKATAAFEKCGFISVRPFNTKQPRGHKKQSRSFNKKAAIRARLHYTRATKPQRLSNNVALFQPLTFVKAARLC
jgi:hypothetical protein